MAKQVTHASVATLAWIPAHNFGRAPTMMDTPKERGVHAVLLSDARRNWMQEYPMKVVSLTEENKAIKIALLDEEWKALLEAKDEISVDLNGKTLKVTPERYREEWRKVWAPKGKIGTELEWEVISGFQRGGSIILANCVRAIENIPALPPIPIIVTEYASETDRIADCAAENLMVNTGRKDVSGHWPTLISIAKKLYLSSNGTISENDLKNVVTGFDRNKLRLGRKVYAICVLDAKFPNMGIVSKITEAGIDKDGVDIGQKYGASLKMEDVCALEQGTCRTPEERKKHDWPEVSEEDVAEYFTNPKTADIVKMPLSKKIMSTLAGKCKNKFLAAALRCCVNGDAVSLAKLDDESLAKSINEFYAIAGFSEKYPD